jgi:hypothetical protein
LLPTRPPQVYRNGLVFVMTSLGIPWLYYGCEQEYGWFWLQYHNASDLIFDPDFREPLWLSNFGTFGLTGTGTIFTLLQRVLPIRAQTRLWEQPMVIIHTSPGVIAFTRGNASLTITTNGAPSFARIMKGCLGRRKER